MDEGLARSADVFAGESGLTALLLSYDGLNRLNAEHPLLAMRLVTRLVEARGGAALLIVENNER